ncbi:MobA/MobL family protein [Microvirga tunisiensis]|uniref:MobA/MobL protein domain-containing protein n=1 Tax=Microvirga tunisiensis TaxID=2108360 RepID=A0A5N7MRG0_9HYPH|nr:MobA/MobL family protein [Microvirga tunisiensis]MPR11593.1 hypothetical protein [Microvirga tunisiensis]MPR29591.1 hypothetical protein [Microvirga tunisiensis]
MPHFDVNSAINYSLKELSMGVTGRLAHQYGGIEPSIKNAWENPGVRFGDRAKGTSRPRSREGKISFHFAQTSISKTSDILVRIREAKSGRKSFKSQAAAHMGYIEREAAAERLSAPVQQQSYIERPGAAERAQMLKDGYDPDLLGIEVSSFGTIGKAFEERTRFWDAVDASEMTPRGDRIKFDPIENPKWWDVAVSHLDSAPKEMQPYLKPGKAESFSIGNLAPERAFAVYQWAQSLGETAPIEVVPGRGGRTQTRIIAELPHELNAKQRLEVVKRFTEELTAKGFPFWAVIHAPDKNNDVRNYHAHIAYYDRPCQRMQDPSTGKEVWDFEIVEEYVSPRRQRRSRRPYRQDRDRVTSEMAWVGQLRKRWSDVSNDVLAEAGADKRLDHRSYKDMGIDLAPLKHIPSRAFNKERKGERTEEGVNLARRQWLVLQQSVELKAPTKLKKIEADIVQRTERAKRAALKAGVVMPAYNKALDIQALKATKVARRLARYEYTRAIFRHVVDRVASRAKLQFHEWEKKNKLKRSKRRPPPKAMKAVMDFLTKVYDTGLQISRLMTQDMTVVTQRLKAFTDGFDRLAKQPPKTAIEASRVAADITKKPERLALTADPYWHGRSEHVQRLVNRIDESFDQLFANFRRQSASQEAASTDLTPKQAPAQAKPTEAPRSIFLSTFMEEQEAARKARRSITIPTTVRRPSQVAKPASIQSSQGRPAQTRTAAVPSAAAPDRPRPAAATPAPQSTAGGPSTPAAARPADPLDPLIAAGARRAGTQRKTDSELSTAARQVAASLQPQKKPEDPKPEVAAPRPPEQAAAPAPTPPKKVVKKRKDQDKDRGR